MEQEIDIGAARIVCAAVRFNVSDHAGTRQMIVVGPRHYDGVMRPEVRMLKANADAFGMSVEEESQGFIDQFGRYYNRQEAWAIANAKGQIIRRVGGDHETLYSENLY